MNHHIDLNQRSNRNRIAKVTVISIGTAILSSGVADGRMLKEKRLHQLVAEAVGSLRTVEIVCRGKGSAGERGGQD